MQEQAGALHVLEEAVTQSLALVRAGNQAGDVGHHKGFFIVHGHHAQRGFERGKRVVGNARPGGAEPRNQGGFAGVRKPDQANVCQKLQFQAQVALFAGSAGIGPPRGLVGGRGKPGVAPAATSAFRHQEAHALGDKIDQLVAVGVVINHGPHGNPDHQIFAVFPVTVGAFAVPGAPRAELFVEPEFQECVEMGGGFQIDAASVAAVTAAGAAARDVLLPAESHTAVSAAAGRDMDLGFVN